MVTAMLRGVGSGRGSSAPISVHQLERASLVPLAKLGGYPSFQFDRCQHLAWNKQAPAGTMFRAVDLYSTVPLYSTVLLRSHRTDLSRAMHVRPCNRNALDSVGGPQAGRVSEGSGCLTHNCGDRHGAQRETK
jgi:hypothetical protein